MNPKLYPLTGWGLLLTIQLFLRFFPDCEMFFSQIAKFFFADDGIYIFWVCEDKFLARTPNPNFFLSSCYLRTCIDFVRGNHQIKKNCYLLATYSNWFCSSEICSFAGPWNASYFLCCFWFVTTCYFSLSPLTLESDIYPLTRVCYVHNTTSSFFRSPPSIVRCAPTAYLSITSLSLLLSLSSIKRGVSSYDTGCMNR